MQIRFFNREVENPVLKVLIAVGAAVFAVALIAAVFAIILPVIGAVLTGVLLIVAVVLILLLLFLPFFAFVGLVFSRGEKGSGVMKSETRELEPFNALKVSGRSQINVTCGDEQRVTVTTDDNLLDNVETKISGEELSVGFSRPVASCTSLRVDITVQELSKLRVYGASRINLERMKTGELFIRISGAAEIDASGMAESLTLRISGAGKYQGAELHSSSAAVTISGAGNAAVHASEKLKAKISGAGRVQCSGNPETVEKHISGAGRVDLV